jgi:WD40 repeat protein
VETLKGHSNIMSVAFHPTLPLLATGSTNIKLWCFLSDGTNATCVSTQGKHSIDDLLVAFHQTLPLLATVSCSKIKLWR